MDYGTGDELHKLETALEAAGIAWWWMELPAGAIFFSPNKAYMLGRSPADFLHYEHFTKLVHPEDYEPMMQAMQDHIQGSNPIYETTYRIKMDNGDYKLFYDRGKVVSKKPDGSVAVAGMVLDITNLPLEVLMKAKHFKDDDA